MEGETKKPMKWAPAEIALLKRKYMSYKEGRIDGYTLRGNLRGRSMAAISKKYWSIYGKAGKKLTDVDLHQGKFDFAQDKVEDKSAKSKRNIPNNTGRRKLGRHARNIYPARKVQSLMHMV